MQICLITAVHGRHGVSGRMLAHYANMRERLPYTLDIVACMSPSDIPEMASNCDLAGVEWMACHNWPVAAKWQSALHYACVVHPRLDAVMIMGSDDFASLEYMEFAGKIVRTGAEAVGPDVVHFLDHESGQMCKWNTRHTGIPAGAGRVVSHRLLNDMNWVLWPKGQSRALDSLCSRTLAKRGKHFDFIEMASVPNGYIIDLKTGHNIHGFGEFTSQELVPYEEAVPIAAACGLEVAA